MKALTLAALFAATAASAQQVMPISYQPEPDFDLVVTRTVRAFQAKDAFDGLEECRVLSAIPIRPFTLDEAISMIKPCLSQVSTRYGAAVTAKKAAAAPEGGLAPQVQGIVLRIPTTVNLTNPLIRDLNQGIKSRNGRILGHPAMVRIEDDAKPAISAAQAALDNCLMTAVIRPVETSEDFIRYYGHCITQAQALKVTELRPSPGHKLGVIALCHGDKSLVESLNGYVAVSGEEGPVKVMVLAYPQMIYLP